MNIDIKFYNYGRLFKDVSKLFKKWLNEERTIARASKPLKEINEKYWPSYYDLPSGGIMTSDARDSKESGLTWAPNMDWPDKPGRSYDEEWNDIQEQNRKESPTWRDDMDWPDGQSADVPEATTTKVNMKNLLPGTTSYDNFTGKEISSDATIMKSVDRVWDNITDTYDYFWSGTKDKIGDDITHITTITKLNPKTGKLMDETFLAELPKNA